MSVPTLRRTGAGAIPQPNRITISKDGQLSEMVVRAINAFQHAIVQKINGRLSFGDASQSSLAGNIYGQYREFTTPSSANTQFQVDHSLGKVVVARLVVRQNKAGELYDVNLTGWGDNAVYFMSSGTTVLYKVLLLSDPDS